MNHSESDCTLQLCGLSPLLTFRVTACTFNTIVWDWAVWPPCERRQRRTVGSGKAGTHYPWKTHTSSRISLKSTMGQLITMNILLIHIYIYKNSSKFINELINTNHLAFVMGLFNILPLFNGPKILKYSIIRNCSSIKIILVIAILHHTKLNILVSVV